LQARLLLSSSTLENYWQGFFLPLGVAKRLDFQSLQNSGIHVVGNLLRLQHAWNPLRYLGFVKWDRAALLKCL
jgi:hypothetical protein